MIENADLCLNAFLYVSVNLVVLAGKESRHPQAGVAVRIVGDGLTREATTDEGGYFAAVLPPGSYELQGRAGTARVEVESGRTALVGLRAGKRMVD